MWLLLLLLLHCATFLSGVDWSDKQRISSQHISQSALDPRNDKVKQKIVLYHNFFRTKVSPTASNMLKMSWHDGAASEAQAYAEECKFLTHNDLADRQDSKLGACGQNLFVSTDKTPWFQALKTWFLEYKDFTYGSPKEPDLPKVGHYTQMVWSTTHKVGCGIAYCKGGKWGYYYNYVCHYCPGGNIFGITSYPYKSGPSCKDCPKHCIADSLCTNTCKYKDVYNNCQEIVVNAAEFCKAGFCNATCNCGDSTLHRNYPW